MEEFKRQVLNNKTLETIKGMKANMSRRNTIMSKRVHPYDPNAMNNNNNPNKASNDTAATVQTV